MDLLMDLKEGIQVLVLGLGITFIALALLVIAIELISKLVNGSGSRAKTTKVETSPEVAEPATPTVDIDDTSKDDELVAVISAAIVAALGDGHQPFKIKQIRQIPANTPRWNQAGRREQLSNR